MSLPTAQVAMVLLTFSAASAAFAEAGSSLTGCWRYYDPDIGNATRITLPSGDPGLSWGIDPETGKELIGRVPHSEFCFAADGSMTTAHFGIDEGLEDSGTYAWDGRVLKVHSDYPGDGWLFGFDIKDASCKAAIAGDSLTLADCTPVSEWLAVTYTRVRQ